MEAIMVCLFPQIQIRYPEYATYNRELYALLRLFWAHMEGVSV